jgi:PhzF family phenazine biosynthesis protein
MPMTRRYTVVDVFSAVATRGNPVAVVLDAAGLDAQSMQHIARWLNLSETTFVLPPGAPGADYRVRIFTPANELPFAGHPTLGSAHAVVTAGLVSPRSGTLVQECGSGLIPLELDADDGGVRYRLRLPSARFAAVTSTATAELQGAIGAPIDVAVAPALVDVGPTWLVARLDSVEQLLALQPNMHRLAALEVSLGATGTTLFAASAGVGNDVEVRSFAPSIGVNEDPVCGSGNGSVAAFRRERGLLPPEQVDYLASQGRCVGRDGRVRVTIEPAGTIWIGGACVTTAEGVLRL